MRATPRVERLWRFKPVQPIRKLHYLHVVPVTGDMIAHGAATETAVGRAQQWLCEQHAQRIFRRTY